METVTEKSHRIRRSAKLSDVGRPRVRPATDNLNLGFKVDPKLVEALDAEAKAMSAEQTPGRGTISRGELIRMLLHEGLATHAKDRAERTKPRA
jgi:hypothetical protein